MVAAKQRDEGYAVFRDREHRRLLGLGVELRCEKADQDPGGANPDDGTAVLKQLLQQRRRAVEGCAFGDPAGAAEQFRFRIAFVYAARDRQSRSGEHDDGGRS